MRERRLDVRGLPPCEPLDRVLDALETLATDEVLVVAIHREPFPLYTILAKRGFTCATAPSPDGNFELRISARQP